MGEYGRIVGESSGAGGGGGGGSSDITGQVMSAIADIADQIVALPPEVLVGMLVVALIGGTLLFWR
jgi:hypothetical protein